VKGAWRERQAGEQRRCVDLPWKAGAGFPPRWVWRNIFRLHPTRARFLDTMPESGIDPSPRSPPLRGRFFSPRAWGEGYTPNDGAMHAKSVEDKPPPVIRIWYHSYNPGPTLKGPVRSLVIHPP
jgi:hypothetical protein